MSEKEQVTMLSTHNPKHPKDI